MGHNKYFEESRTIRATQLGYKTKSMDEVFTQQRQRKIHESMSPFGVKIREARDSENHINTVPIVLSLDVTGSMGKIPMELIREGLPKLMTKLIGNGIEDASLLFVAVGDHEHDHYPFQIGQFESGDEELDTWLTRTYIEGGGGGNAGESYMLAWYFSAFHTSIDSFEKRGKKGYLFTIGDEPCLKIIPKNVIKEIFGDDVEKSYSDEELLEEAQKLYNVYHLHIIHGPKSEKALGYWKELLGDNCIEVRDYTTVSSVISDTIILDSLGDEVPSIPQLKSVDEFLIDEML